MIVMKFGGTSVQDEEAIGRVISIVKNRLPEKPLVVVSALSKVTKLLCSIAEAAEAQQEDVVKESLASLRQRHFDLAKALLKDSPLLLEKCLGDLESRIAGLETFAGGVCQIGELSPRSEARIISTGELLSSTIIAYAFNAQGISCQWLDARRMITTDNNYLNARPDLVVTEANVKRVFGMETKGFDLVLTQGFVASASDGSTTVLGFEGSDYSAAIFGMALGAKRVEIWTDVDGIRSTDPRALDSTRRIECLSYEEAAEMAAMGARVLHPLTIEPARNRNIPIMVLNSKNPACAGSTVLRGEESPDGPKSVACRENVVFIKVHSPKMEGITGMLARVFAPLYSNLVPVTLAKATESSVYLVIPEETDGLEAALAAMEKWAEVTVYRDKSMISVVGRNIVGLEGLGDRIIEASGKVYIANVSADMLSENFVIDRDRLAVTLSTIHDYIFNR